MLSSDTLKSCCCCFSIQKLSMATLHRCQCPSRITGVAQHRPVLLHLPRQLLLRLDLSKSRKIKAAGWFFFFQMFSFLLQPVFLILLFFFSQFEIRWASCKQQVDTQRVGEEQVSFLGSREERKGRQQQALCFPLSSLNNNLLLFSNHVTLWRQPIGDVERETFLSSCTSSSFRFICYTSHFFFSLFFFGSLPHPIFSFFSLHLQVTCDLWVLFTLLFVLCDPCHTLYNPVQGKKSAESHLINEQIF